MARALDRDTLLAAFDEIGRAAATAGTTLQIVVYGGSALMLASNFRFATEDADVAPLEKPWPDWLRSAVERITAETGWAEDWFNDGIAFHLSAIADHAVDHLWSSVLSRETALHRV
jgi:predicted proteasome-type protease